MDARLREYDTGARTGLTREEYAATLAPEAAAAWDAHSHVEAEGGESVADVGERIVPALLEVLDGLEEGRTAVVVLHGAALRVALAGLLGWPLGDRRRSRGDAQLRLGGAARARPPPAAAGGVQPDRRGGTPRFASVTDDR